MAIFSIGIFQTAFGQHHGGEQAPPISFGKGQVTVSSEIIPMDYSPELNSSLDLKIRFFETSTNKNIENVSYRVKIFNENSLIANQMFFDRDGELEVKIRPKTGCDQKELWKCTRYEGEKDPIVPNALTSSALSKPVIIGPVFDKSGEYTLEISIIGANNPKTQTSEDITFQTKIVIPSSQQFTLVSNGNDYLTIVKDFQNKTSNLVFDESSKSLILQTPIDWSHLEHIDTLKNIIEIPKDFPPFKNIIDLTAKVNGEKTSSKVIHFDDISKKNVNVIHLSLSNDDLKKINQRPMELEFVIQPNTESSKTKKEILFANGYKAKVSHDSRNDENKESFFTISFFDKDENILPNIRYGYSLKDPYGKEIVNTGSNPNLIGIEVPSGSETRYLKTEEVGVYEMKLVLIGKSFSNFDEFMFQTYNFEINGSSASEVSTIPEWIKNNAKWWAEDQIDDDSFVQGIQFMIKNKIIRIPNTANNSESFSGEIPGWIKNNAKWWAEDQIDDDSFVQGIQFLIKVGIIKIR
ncbi:MAG: peptidase [Nitrosopumilaceae archaeon]|nr:peptidase [Nitrosopumilaceae archaeon]